MFLDHCWLFDRHSLNPCLATKLLTPPHDHIWWPCPALLTKIFDPNHHFFAITFLAFWQWKLEDGWAEGEYTILYYAEGWRSGPRGLRWRPRQQGRVATLAELAPVASSQAYSLYIHLLPITYLTTALNGWYILTSVYLDPARLTNNQHCGPTQP